MKTKITNTTTNRLFAGRCSSAVGSAIRPLTSVFCLLTTLCLLATAPQAKAATPPVIAVAASYEHSLYVTSDGSLYAMGLNEYGELGDGTTTTRYTPVKVATNVIAVAAGGDYWDYYGSHSLYVTSDGSLYAMGRNDSGELGIGSSEGYRSTPVKVASNVIAVAAGQRHSLYVTNDGSLYAMGNNSSGQLGDGTTTDRSTPVKVASNVELVPKGRVF